MEEDGRMVLRTEGLVKRYGKRTVVSHVSINVRQGEIVGLLGPNGAGKTTTIKAMLNIIGIDSGSISMPGLDYLKAEREIKGHIHFLKLTNLSRDDIMITAKISAMRGIKIERFRFTE